MSDEVLSDTPDKPAYINAGYEVPRDRRAWWKRLISKLTRNWSAKKIIAVVFAFAGIGIVSAICVSFFLLYLVYVAIHQ